MEGIDFSRGERWVGESRPFFQEGGRVFQTDSGVGGYFYSRRIEHIDLGAKLHGRLAKRTTLGLLGTYDFANQLEDPWDVDRHDHVAGLSQGIGEWGSLAARGVRKRAADRVGKECLGDAPPTCVRVDPDVP